METMMTTPSHSGAFDVYATRCPDYAYADKAILQLITRMGGVKQFYAPGEQVALKVNLLRKADPDDAVTTHPLVVSALSKMISDDNAHAIIVDSPGGGYRFNRHTLQSIYRATGMTAVAADTGAELNYDTDYEILTNPQGCLIKRFEVISRILKADVVFNVCKLKTHTFMHLTGAVKNLFGVVPGHFKPGYHGKLPDTPRFAGMLLDLAHAIKTKLTVMDAVVAMEGEGPSAGTPKPCGWLLASTNPLALDVVAGFMTGLSPSHHPLLLEAQERGVVPNRMEQIRLIGAGAEQLKIPGFKLPSTIQRDHGDGYRSKRSRRLKAAMLKNSFSLKPRIDVSACVGCGACAQTCPVDVITMMDGRKGPRAQIDAKSCIRCYCCHEICPEKAVQLNASWRYRMARSIFLAH